MHEGHARVAQATVNYAVLASNSLFYVMLNFSEYPFIMPLLILFMVSLSI